MIGRVPKHRHSSDEVEPFAFHVFIPGALASGFLVSVGLLVSDALRRVRGDRGVLRRTSVTGAAVAAEVRDGFGAARQVSFGLRRRITYGLIGVLAAGLVVAAVPGATWNFFHPGGYISDIAWIWAVSMLGVIAVAVLAAQALSLAPEWVPNAAVLIGSGVLLRFLVGPEEGVVRAVVVIVVAIATPLTVAVTWRLRHRRRIIQVPEAARPLLTSTPLGRQDRPDRGALSGPTR